MYKVLFILILLTGCCENTAEKNIVPVAAISVTFTNDSTIVYHAENDLWDVHVLNDGIRINHCVEANGYNLYIPFHNIKYFIYKY